MGTIVEGCPSCPRALRAAGALALAALAAGAAFGAPHAAAAVADYTFVTIPPPVLQASSNFGERVRAIGDIDDDGVRDVLMSSSTFDGEDANGATLANSGRVYVFSGRTQALLRVVDPPFPQAGGRFGFWDASLGDVDGDGAGDFVVGASGMIVGGATIGQAYIFSGRTGQRLRTLNPPEPITPTSANGGDFGGNVLGPGDLNGDGVGDVVVSSSGAFSGAGAVYAFNGKTGAFLYKAQNPDPVQAIGQNFGFGAAELGDVNGDGAGDYQIGAPRYDEGAVADVGRSYVISGASGTALRTLMDPEPAANNRFGQADADNAVMPDITGDGVPDIYVNTFLADETIPPNPTIPDAGKAHLFNGATGAYIRTLHDSQPTMARQFGASNARAGDIDGDGLQDILVSSRGAANGKVTALGGPNLTTILKVFADPNPIQGQALFGTGIASPGDVNGDGRPDYFISARAADVGALADTGIAYAFISVPPAVAPPPPPPAIAPPPPPPPPPTGYPLPGARAGKLSARVLPAADRRAPFRFRVTGKLTLPAGVAPADGCRGRVTVTVRRGATTILTRRVSLRSACTYGATVSFANRRRFGRATRLRITARFAGNARVLRATAPSRTVRVR